MKDLIIVCLAVLVLVAALLASTGGASGDTPKMQTVFERMEYHLAKWRQAKQDRETDARCELYRQQKKNQHDTISEN